MFHCNKSRIICKYGKTREIIVDMAEVDMAIYGKTVSLIGGLENIQIAKEAVEMIFNGSRHKSVYGFLEHKQQELKLKGKLAKYKESLTSQEIESLIEDTKNTSLRRDFLECIKMLPNWNEEYIKLFPTVLSRALISDLIEGGFTSDVQKLVRTSFESSKDFRDTVIYFFKNCQNEDWYKESGVSFEKQLITLVKILEITQREIDNHVNSTDNKKIQKTICDLLFKDKKFTRNCYNTKHINIY